MSKTKRLIEVLNGGFSTTLNTSFLALHHETFRF